MRKLMLIFLFLLGVFLISSHPFHAEEYIIKAKNIEAIQSKYPIQVLDQIPNTSLYKIEAKSFIEELKHDPFIEEMYKNVSFKIAAHFLSSIEKPMWSLESMNFPTTIVGRNTVTIGLLDTGVDASHPALKGYILEGYSALGESDTDDQNGHGTQMAGAIVLHSPQTIKVLPIQVLDSSGRGNLYSILKGLYYAMNQNVDIINMSLGYPSHIPALQEGVEKATEKGIIMVAAAGNNGVPSLMYPAAYEPVIAVGAYNAQEMRSNFSQYGPTLDFIAPGEAVYTTGLNHSFTYVDGTSISASLVTKAISWLYTQSIERRLDDTMDLLRQAAVDMDEPGFDYKTGFGKIDVKRLLLLNEIRTDSMWKVFGKKENVPSSKIWRIDFNLPLSPDSIHHENVMILDADNKPIKGITFKLVNNHKTLMIYPPESGYDEGSYTLYIRGAIYSEKKRYLKQPVKKEFAVLGG